MPGKTYKGVVLGAKGTGKTALLEEAIYGNHLIGSGMPSTVEDIYAGNILTEKGVPEMFRFYDTCPLDCQKPVIPKLYFSVADAYILVFDITRWETFHCLNALRADIEKNRERREPPVILVLGNKSDLENESRQIETDTVSKWAQKERVKFLEVSVTNRKSVLESFAWLATRLTQAPQRGSGLLKFKKSTSGSGGAAAVLSVGIPGPTDV